MLFDKMFVLAAFCRITRKSLRHYPDMPQDFFGRFRKNPAAPTIPLKNISDLFSSYSSQQLCVLTRIGSAGTLIIGQVLTRNGGRKMKLEPWVIEELLRKERSRGDYGYLPLYLELPNLIEPPPVEIPSVSDDDDFDEDDPERSGVIIIDIS